MYGKGFPRRSYQIGYADPYVYGTQCSASLDVTGQQPVSHVHLVNITKRCKSGDYHPSNDTGLTVILW